MGGSLSWSWLVGNRAENFTCSIFRALWNCQLFLCIPYQLMRMFGECILIVAVLKFTATHDITVCVYHIDSLSLSHSHVLLAITHHFVSCMLHFLSPPPPPPLPPPPPPPSSLLGV